MRLRQSTRPASQTRGRMFMLALGGFGIAVALGMLFIGYNAPNSIPGRSYYNLQAEFDDADNLTKSYQVRIGGRLVGQVLEPRVENGKGIVKLQLIPDIKPLKSDTTLRVRPRSAVGVRFVEMIPGTRGTDLDEGGRIVAANTSETVQLDEALGTLDADRRVKFRTLMSELGNSFASRGEDINTTLRDAPEFLSDLDEVAGAVNARNGAPTRFVQQSAGAANAADPVRNTIAEGFEPESEALDVFVDTEDGLRRFLNVAPGSLARVRAGLAQTSPLLTATRAMAAELEPALRSGVPALRNTSALLREARPGLRQLPDTFELVEDAVPPTLQVLDTVVPTLPDIDKATSSPLGILDILGPRGCDIKQFTNNWRSMLGFGGANGSTLRFNAIGSAESVLGATEKTPLLNATPVRSNPYPAPCSTGFNQELPR